MSYRIHIVIVLMLIFVQFFFTKMLPKVYLRIVESSLKASEGLGHNYFLEKEYNPLSKEAPKKYKFVSVTNYDNKLEEVYFTEQGDKIAVVYLNGKWHKTSSINYPYFITLIFPLIGFILCCYSMLHKVSRTGKILAWELTKIPYDYTEKLLLLYGIPLFISALIYSLLKLVFKV